MLKTWELALSSRERLIQFRRELHQHPELSGQEVHTSARVFQELEKLGIEVKTGYAVTGLQGMLWGNPPGGRTILLRADMDALQMEELGGCAYRSQIPGAAHTCGHDAHTAALLGAAVILTEMKEQLRGNVKFCFQPAEEGVGGADLMVKDGILENPKVDYAVGMHVDPSMPVGSVCVEPGPISAYPDFFKITITGKGGHGAFPSRSNDPILPATQAYSMIHALQKRVSPLEPSVIQICMFQAGSAQAIIPDSAVLGGTVRTQHAHNRDIIRTGIENICACLRDLYGVECVLEYRGHSFPVTNTPAMVPGVRQSIAPIFEGGFLSSDTLSIGGEDFCFYCPHTPTTFFLAGCANDQPATHFPLHSPYFELDEEVILRGAAAYAQIALDYLDGRIE